MAHLTSNCNPEYSVGDGASACVWADRLAGTVTKVTKKTVTVRRDKATKLGVVNGEQSWHYEFDADGSEDVYSLRKNGRFVIVGDSAETGTTLIQGRREYVHIF